MKTSEAFAADPSAVMHGRRVRIDPSARISGSILWDDVEVGARVTLEGCIVTDGVRVPAGATHHRTMLIASPGGDLIAHAIENA